MTPANSTQTPAQAPPAKIAVKARPFRSKAIALPVISILLIGINLVAGLLLTNASAEGNIISSHFEALQRNRQNLEKLQTDVNSYRGKIDQLQNSLLKEKQIPDFIQFVNNTATKHNTTLLLNFTTNQPTQTKDNLWVIPLSLQINTTLKDLTNFLQALNQGPYQLRFDRLEAEALKDLDQEITVRLTGNLFVDSQFTAP